jgi:protein-S-isoprenylcysteine O-methyltransferase Ste14
MVANAPAVPRADSPRNGFIEAVTQPRVDRVVAIVACFPMIGLTYYRFTHDRVGVPLLAYSASVVILLLTMVVRRPPKRLTPNPWFWALAFFGTYWAILTVAFMQRGRPLAPALLTDSLAVLSLAVLLWARVSLGKNIGFVPAQREIVTSGAYAHLRHPIYTGLFIAMLSVALRSYSSRNVALLATGALLLMIKSIVEERFLSADPQYAAYLQKVRNRWIPFVL